MGFDTESVKRENKRTLAAFYFFFILGISLVFLITMHAAIPRTFSTKKEEKTLSLGTEEATGTKENKYSTGVCEEIVFFL